MDIILASTSPYRRRLLERLQLPFCCVPPEIEETPLPEETPIALAKRLARLKAVAVAKLHPDGLVIGSDQVASIDGCSVGKPGDYDRAMAQLQNCSGREMLFYTALTLVCLGRNFEEFHVEPYKVRFRRLDDSQIDSYLRREQPYDCAGSFKVEGLGIALFEGMSGNDPTSLEGLPLIKLCELLSSLGVKILGR